MTEPGFSFPGHTADSPSVAAGGTYRPPYGAERQTRPGSLGVTTSSASPFPQAKPGAHSPRSLKLETTGLSSHAQLQFRSVVREAQGARLVQRLKLGGFSNLAATIEACGTEPVYLICGGCRTTRKVFNHCDNHLCPKCQPRLARERFETIKFWAAAITQPKHVVLTCKNQPFIDTKFIREFVALFAKLRRQAWCRHWRSGMWSIEVTNEGKGWHLHVHALIDARWIDQIKLASAWAKLIGQQKAIVKVLDARAADYVREVAKYAVKGSDLAKWSVSDLTVFVNAIQGCRTFGTFGALYKERSKWNALLQSLRDDRRKCECGCDSWQILSENEYEAKFCTYIPPPVRRPSFVDPQLTLI